jgi:hypothetical protein
MLLKLCDNDPRSDSLLFRETKNQVFRNWPLPHQRGECLSRNEQVRSKIISLLLPTFKGSLFHLQEAALFAVQ